MGVHLWYDMECLFFLRICKRNILLLKWILFFETHVLSPLQVDYSQQSFPWHWVCFWSHCNSVIYYALKHILSFLTLGRLVNGWGRGGVNDLIAIVVSGSCRNDVVSGNRVHRTGYIGRNLLPICWTNPELKIHIPCFLNYPSFPWFE